MLCFILAGAISAKLISWNVLAIFWSLFTVIIIATYTVYLTAYLTVTVTTLPIHNIEDLANSPDFTLIVEKGTMYVSLFAVSYKLYELNMACRDKAFHSCLIIVIKQSVFLFCLLESQTWKFKL